MRITKRQLRRIIREETEVEDFPRAMDALYRSGRHPRKRAAGSGMKGADREKFQTVMKGLRAAQALAKSVGGGDAVTALKKAEKALLMAIARQGK